MTQTTHEHSPADADEPVIGVLRKHRLPQFKEIKVGRSILASRMARSCSADACGSTCCGTGVLADRAEQERILAHVDAIHRAMDADQPHDPKDWFDDEVVHDDDFPSKVAIGTRTNARGCIFLNGQGRCVLQKAHMEGLSPVVLKPFYCFAFPITIDRGTLMVDIDNVEGTPRCCVPVKDGERTIMDVFEWELTHVLGEAGVAELREVLASTER